MKFDYNTLRTFLWQRKCAKVKPNAQKTDLQKSNSSAEQLCHTVGYFHKSVFRLSRIRAVNKKGHVKIPIVITHFAFLNNF